MNRAANPALNSPARTSALQILLHYRKSGVLTESDCEKAENRRLADRIAFGTV